MKNSSSLPITSLSVIFVLALAIGGYVYFALKSAEEKVYDRLVEKLVSDLDDEEKFMEKIGITNAILISDNARIKEAIMKDDRNAALDELQVIFEKFKSSTRIKDLKVHIHTADVKSYIRNWKPEKYGDDLSGFRKTIVKVKETHKPVFSFEVGRMGLTLRSIVPIMEGDQYLGSLEFIQAFDNVPKNFEKRGNHHLLLMNDSLLYIASYLKTAPSIDHYKLSSKFYNQEFLNEAQKIDIDKLETNKYLMTEKYMYTIQHITDLNGNKVGLHLLGMPSKAVYKAIESEKQSAWILAGVSSVLLIFILIFILVSHRKKQQDQAN